MIPTTYPVWEQPVAWLFGYVDTDSPGYRKLAVDGTTVTLTPGYYAFPSLVFEVENALSAVDWYADFAGSGVTGQVELGGSVATVTAVDRLAWLLGFDLEVGEVLGVGDLFQARAPSPAAVPLQHCVWSVVDREAERELQLDRFGRGHGYVYGAADVWRFSIRVDQAGYDALRTGWVLAGRVIVSPFTPAQHKVGAAVAWSADTPTGYVTGRVLGLEPGGRWRDNTAGRRLWEGSLLVEVTS